MDTDPSLEAVFSLGAVIVGADLEVFGEGFVVVKAMRSLVGTLYGEWAVSWSNSLA